MKRILIVFAFLMGLLVTSCTGCKNNSVQDSVVTDSVVVDSVVTDSVVIDSVVTLEDVPDVISTDSTLG